MVNTRLWSFKFKGSSMLEMVKIIPKMINLVIMRQGWVLYELCLLLPLERVIGMELSGFVALIYGLDISRDGYKGVALDSHEFKVIYERLLFHFSLSCIGEGNGNPLQCSCLENPRDGGALWAAVYGVAQSWTRLKRLSSSSMLTN